MLEIFLQPYYNNSPVLYTEACLCIVFCIYLRIFAVSILPFLVLSFYIIAIEFYPASFGNYGCFCPGLYNYFVVKAAALPNITKSNKEFAPNLLAP